MSTEFAEHANTTLAIAEDDQVLAEQTGFHRGAVGRYFLRQASRDPMAPHELAHRGIAFDAAQQIIFFRRHGFSSFWPQGGFRKAEPVCILDI